MPMVTAAAISAGGSLLGGYFSGKSAEKSAKKAAEAQLQAARTAASASAFRPVGMTTRFGSSQFQMGTDQYGTPIVTGANYQASPEIQALQDRLSALYGTSLGQAETAGMEAQPLFEAGRGLFGLGAQYLGESPEAVRNRYVQQQLGLIEPIRQQEEARLASSVFGRGRAGVNVGVTGQPELSALANARRMQDLQLAANAEQAAQQQIGFGAGLFGQGAGLFGTGYGMQTQALGPFQTQFGVQSALEAQALQPLELGANLGGRNVNTTGAQALLTGGLGAAQTQLQGSLVGPTAMMQNLATFGQNLTQGQRQQQLFDYLSGQQYAPEGLRGMAGSSWQQPAPVSIATPVAVPGSAEALYGGLGSWYD